MVLIAGDDPAVTDALAAGLRRAFDESRAAGGPDVALRVTGRPRGNWASLAETAVTEAIDARALAFVGPPEREHAHLLAQLATRAKVPMLSTSAARSVAAAGSRWVEAVGVEAAGVEAAAPAATADGDARRWEAVGHAAGRRALALAAER